VADPFPLNSSDLDAISTFEAGAALVGEDQAFAFTRLLGNAAERVAEAAVEIFAMQAAASVAVAGATEADHGRASVDATALTRAVPEAFGDLLHQHLRRSVRRALVTAMENEPDAVLTTVGFVDLVGSTAWTRGLTNTELAHALVQFEAAAFDIAADHGGWVVKMIGDAAMFEVADPAAACRIALDLCAAIDACPDLPLARGGLASGVVQARDGDFFGTTVNLAARAAGVADPSSVAVNELVAEHLAETCPPHWQLEPMPPKDLRGFDDPPPLFRLTSSGTPSA
jgi:class 3 adenylate cyclase